MGCEERKLELIDAVGLSLGYFLEMILNGVYCLAIECRFGDNAFQLWKALIVNFFDKSKNHINLSIDFFSVLIALMDKLLLLL